jgi:ribosome-binding protein aMBF1 (putative translation factor)
MKKKIIKNKKLTKKEDVGKYNPVSFSSVRKEWMEKPSFRKAKQQIHQEYMLIHQIIDGRIKNNISQKELAKRLGTGQSAISRLESGTYNPSFKFLKKLAKALETDLTITFSK